MTQSPWGAPPSNQTPWPPANRWPQQTFASPQWPAPQQAFTQPQWPAQQPQQWPQQQQWPAPQQQQWPAPQPPARRGSFLGTIIKVALVIAALMFVSSVVRGLLAPTGETTTTTTPPSGGGSQTGQTGPYVNESYTPPPADMNPPALPVPRDVSAATRLVQDNPFYAEQVPGPTRCDVAPINGLTGTRSQLQSQITDLMGCLMTVWDSPVEASGFALPRPPVVVYNSPVKTACGTFDEVNAAYCSGDQRIYYAQSLLKAFPSAVRQSPYAVEMIVAHEFGHALQARTAILASEVRLEQRASSQAASNELSRRTEVQADCLAGQFVRSVALSQDLDSADLAALSVFTYALGDDVLSGKPGFSEGHGLGDSRRAWFEKGLASSEITTCNSFVADAAQVR